MAGDGDKHIPVRVAQNLYRRVLGKRPKRRTIPYLPPLQDATAIELKRHHVQPITYGAARHVNVTSLVSHDRGAKLRYPRTAAVLNLAEQRAGHRVVSKYQDIGEIIGTGRIPHHIKDAVRSLRDAARLVRTGASAAPGLRPSGRSVRRKRNGRDVGIGRS